MWTGSRTVGPAEIVRKGRGPQAPQMGMWEWSAERRLSLKQTRIQYLFHVLDHTRLQGLRDFQNEACTISVEVGWPPETTMYRKDAPVVATDAETWCSLKHIEFPA